MSVLQVQTPPMRYLLVVFCFLSLVSLGQELELKNISRERNPITPSQVALDALKPIEFHKLKELRVETSKGSFYRKYELESELYNGWALLIYKVNEHKYRYMKIEKGLVVWQIGFYDNGDLDLDFRGKDGVNYGIQRMWRKGGSKYIDTYFLEGAIQHGMQYRWAENNTLAEESKYENGSLIYRLQFDQHQKVIKSEGLIPDKYR